MLDFVSKYLTGDKRPENIKISVNNGKEVADRINYYWLKIWKEYKNQPK